MYLLVLVMSEDGRLVYKIILIGDPGVGKTSLRRRYMGEGFKENYQITIGADFSVKRISKLGSEYMIQIWDLSGQDSFKSVRKIYYRNTHGIILVFDITKSESLENTIKWIKEYRQSPYFNDNIPCVLVGNKIDLVEINDFKEYVPYSQSIEDLMENQTQLHFSSALTGKNVELIFEKLLEMIIK